MSGSIRRTQRKFGRSYAGRTTSSLFSFHQKTTQTGLGARVSGPGSFFKNRTAQNFLYGSQVCSVKAHSFFLYSAGMEVSLGSDRSNFHE